VDFINGFGQDIRGGEKLCQYLWGVISFPLVLSLLCCLEWSSIEIKEGIIEIGDESRQIRKILETPFWLEGVDTEKTYQIDEEGSRGRLTVWFSPDGDVLVNTYTDDVLCDNKEKGRIDGSKYLRTRTALMILALAIKLDNEAIGN